MAGTATLADLQLRLHDRLSRYVNGCALSRGARIECLLSPALAYRRHAAGVASLHREFRAALDGATAGAAAAIEVAPYAGSSPQVLQMGRELAALGAELAGAFVHGSLATGEEIAYSDFDGLVILRDATAGDPRRLAPAALRLNALRRLMFAFDPLQHHGWFVLTEADLRHHCEEFFPADLFRHSRSLLGDGPVSVAITPRDSTAECGRTLARAAGNLRRRVDPGQQPRDMIELKSALSEFMLLPALYLQARHGRGVFKKSSFAEAAADFTPADWAVMDEASAIRRRWHYDLGAVGRLALTRTVRARKLATRWFAPGIPADLAAMITPQFWERAARLAGLMEAAAG